MPLVHSTVPENGTALVVPSSAASSNSDWLPAMFAGLTAAMASSAVCGVPFAAGRRSSVEAVASGVGASASGSTTSGFAVSLGEAVSRSSTISALLLAGADVSAVVIASAGLAVVLPGPVIAAVSVFAGAGAESAPASVATMAGALGANRASRSM
jgi:hypothetical protein